MGGWVVYFTQIKAALGDIKSLKNPNHNVEPFLIFLVINFNEYYFINKVSHKSGSCLSPRNEAAHNGS